MQFELFENWLNSSDKNDLLKALQKVSLDDVPLKLLAQHTGMFDDQSLQFSVLTISQNKSEQIIRLSLFFRELSNLCPCSGDDIEKHDGFCELLLTLNRHDRTAVFSLL